MAIVPICKFFLLFYGKSAVSKGLPCACESHIRGFMIKATTKIISGRFGGRKLAVPEGMSVRPTLSRCRKSLFDVLGSRFTPAMRADMIFADIFAGSGAMGLEAVSVGFGKAIFIEKAKESLECLQSNIAMAADEVEVIKCDAFFPPSALAAVDILFFDPPYDTEPDRWQDLLAAYKDKGWMKEGGLVILQYGVKLKPALSGEFSISDERVIGKSAFGFIFA